MNNVNLLARKIHDFVTKTFFCSYNYKENEMRIYPHPALFETLPRSEKLKILSKIRERIEKISTKDGRLLPIIYNRPDGKKAIKVKCESYELFLKICYTVKRSESHWGFLQGIPDRIAVKKDYLYRLIVLCVLIVSLTLVYTEFSPNMHLDYPFTFSLALLDFLLIFWALSSSVKRNLLKTVETLYLLERTIQIQPLIVPVEFKVIAHAIKESVGRTRILTKLLIQELSITGHFRYKRQGFFITEYFVYTGKPPATQEGEIESPTPTPDVNCIRCGAKLAESDKICPECGYALMECAICKRDLSFGEAIASCPICSTQFHDEHIREWLRIKRTCPVCRNEIDPNELKELTVMGMLRLLV